MNHNCFINAKNRLKFEFPYSEEEWVNNHMLMENYHKHTTWSDLVQIDCATSIDDFIAKSKELGCQCYFSGEHGYQGEWLFCYDLCKKYDIKFRYSAEVYWVKDINPDFKDKTNCHMVIVARTYNAMRKLNYIITKAHEEGFYYHPRIDLNLLFTLSPEDVYITSACIAGWKYEDATELWIKIWNHFQDSFFLEYQTNNTSWQRELNQKISTLSNELGIQTIIGLDTHYLNELDKIKRENLLQRKKMSYPEEDGAYMDFPNGEEVYRRMMEQGIVSEEDILYSMMNTQIFINGCEELSYNRDFKIPRLVQYKDFSYEDRCKELHRILMDCYEKEDANHKSQDRIEGIEYEFGEIVGSGTADYFLSNHELVNLAVNKYGGQLTTTSRGSASSYYCSKLLGFTTMDRFEAEVPIYPERFITKDRVLSSHQMPDIDLNISSQEPFASAARELFGEHGCYPLLAVGKLGEKSGFKLYADIEGLDPTTANEITSMIDAFNEAKKNADDDDKDSILIEDFITDKKYLKIFNDSKSYQGIIDQCKVHACGFLIFNGNPNQSDLPGYGDIRYEIGLIRSMSKSTGKSTLVVNAEGGMLDLYGYVKDDFLIVDVVSIIWKFYHAIGREVPTVSELGKMVENDDLTWNLYANGITCCLNQCEKQATTRRVMEYKPKNRKELAAFIAAIRPGFKSLINGFLQRIPYSNGEKAIDDILEDCFHFMLYQEAVMKIFSYLGIPMKDSYDTIKKISKKKLKGAALEHVENTLKEHWLENVGNLDNFESVYKVIKDSARYSFNAPHALAMANDSLYEAWGKAHYTSKFYEVTMNHYQDKGDKDKVAELQKEATEKFEYNLGSYKFGNDNSKIVVDDETKTIYPNLATIKFLNGEIAEDLYKISFNHRHYFVEVLEDIATTLSINSRQLDILIKIDYFSDYGDINKLLKIYKEFGLLYGKKNIHKKNLEKYDIDENLVKEYCVKTTDAMYKYEYDSIMNLLKKYEETVSYNPCTVGEIIKYQQDMLGYVDYIDKNADQRVVVVMNLNTTYSPKFSAYNIKTGKSCELKVSSRKNPKDANTTSFSQIPFENGDVLWMDKCTKKPKCKKTEDGFVQIPGEFSWWLTKYHKVKI